MTLIWKEEEWFVSVRQTAELQNPLSDILGIYPSDFLVDGQCVKNADSHFGSTYWFQFSSLHCLSDLKEIQRGPLIKISWEALWWAPQKVNINLFGIKCVIQEYEKHAPPQDWHSVPPR